MQAEPATTRIKRLLKVLSSYSFNLYHRKGKDMILGDFLSRQKNDDNNTHEIIPISFNMRQILHDRYYSIGQERKKEKYLVQTRSQSKASGITLSQIHGAEKHINLHVNQRKKIKPMTITPEVKIHSWRKSRLGQGRAGLR